MKNTKLTIFALLVMLVSTVGYAQAPKNGILIKMDDYTLDVAGGEASTKVYFVRSKRLSKVKLEAPKVQAPAGYEVSLEPIADEKDAYMMTVKASAPSTENLTLIVDGAGRWRNSIQSATFSISSDAVASKN